MSRQIIVRSEALYDTIDIAHYIFQDSMEASDRFVEAVDLAYKRLAEMPGIGVARDYGNPKLAGTRMWPISGFENYLIFYYATDTELQILRVLHGSRDISSLFASEE